MITKIIIFVSLFVVFTKNVDAQPVPKRPLPPSSPPIPSRPPRPSHHLSNERNPYTRFQIFYVDEVEREDGEIEIEFNMPFNPESVIRENILINNMALPKHIIMSFNRRGNKIHIIEEIEWQQQQISIEIKNIRSINDLEMRPLPAFYLWYDDSYEWDEPHKVRWVLEREMPDER